MSYAFASGAYSFLFCFNYVFFYLVSFQCLLISKEKVHYYSTLIHIRSAIDFFLFSRGFFCAQAIANEYACKNTEYSAQPNAE